jgi:hypothetical protein
VGISYDNHRGEAKPTATFDDCGATLDLDDLIDQLATSRFGVLPFSTFGTSSATTATTAITTSTTTGSFCHDYSP